MQELNYGHLRYFCKVCETGTIKGAADTLRVSSPTVSEQIKQLEAYLGKPLFDRESGRLRLTKFGREVHAYARRIFEAGDRFVQTFVTSDNVEHPVIEIGIATPVAGIVTGQKFFNYLRSLSMPARLRVADTERLAKFLDTRAIDLFLTEEVLSLAKGTEVREIYSPEYCLVASKGRAEKADTIERVKHLFTDPGFIHYTTNSTIRSRIEEYFRMHDISPKVVTEVDDANITISAVAEDFGVAILPRSVVELELQSGMIQDVAPINDVGVTIYCYYHSLDRSEHVQAALDSLSLL